MVLSETTLFVVLDARYYEKLSTLDASQIHERCGKHIIITPILLNQKIEDIIKEHLNTRKIQIENSVPLSFYHSLLDYGFEVKIKAPYFTKQRLTKYESEIKALKKAIQIIKKVWREIEKLNAA
ncbi:MAG: hypothetical protein H6767_09340 [Candidatus Peribacteria bacterium]|nr:MAG: hypothetical protein H6767_09340 [Candidatus Peribacteria bacterium]